MLHFVLVTLMALAVMITPAFSASAYLYNMPTASSLDADINAARPSSSLPQLLSKVLVQSPSLDNVYRDYVVTSKPLNLRKYKNGNKTKKTKKDSKIYYIPIPPLPYRYIPGIGYDYQPMKIKPILQEEAAPVPMPNTPPATPPVVTTIPPSKIADDNVMMESKLLRVQHRNNYYFNGRPFRLQVAHAGRKHALTPQNLKSKFYYNKNIIY